MGNGAGDRRRRLELTGHPAADLLRRSASGGDRRAHPTRTQRGDAVAEQEQLVEVLGDHQDRRTGIAQGDQRAVDQRRRADVHAPGGMRRHQQARGLEDLAVEDELLQVAAGKAACRRPGTRGLHGETADDLLGQRQHLAPPDQPTLHQALLEGGEQRIVRQAHLRHRAVPQPLGGHEGLTGAAPRIRRQVRAGAAAEADALGLGARQAHFAAEQSEQLVLAVAGDPGDTEDLAATHLQVEAGEGHAEGVRVAPVQVAHLEERRAASDLRILRRQALGVAHHQPRQLEIGTLRRHALSGHPSAAQHRGALAERTDLGQLVADEEDTATLLRKTAQGDEEILGLARGQHRGRLVEDQQADVLHQAAHDLHPLTLADGQPMDQPARLQRHAVALRHLANTRLQPARAARLGAEGERDVLRHAERLEQGEMLEHHADPQRPGASRVAHLHRLALPADLAGIGTGHAVDDLHQRALAGAVLTEQGVDLAGVDAQVDAVVGQATRIALADPA